jgi:hypothetical protein
MNLYDYIYNWFFGKKRRKSSISPMINYNTESIKRELSISKYRNSFPNLNIYELEQLLNFDKKLIEFLNEETPDGIFIELD